MSVCNVRENSKQIKGAIDLLLLHLFVRSTYRFPLLKIVGSSQFFFGKSLKGNFITINGPRRKSLNHLK